MSVGLWDPDSDKQSRMIVEVGVIDSFLRLSSNRSLTLEDLEKAGVASQQMVMKIGAEAWQVAELRSVADLDHLIRVFTLIEALPGWDAGSKSPVIPLVKILKARDQFDPELRKWIKSNTDNRYLPYGSAL